MNPIATSWRAIWRHRFMSDVRRLIGFLALSATALWLSNWLPEASGEVTLAPLLNLAGIMFAVAAVVQYLRRIWFPWMDLKTVALPALKSGSIGAGLVFLGVCIVMAAATISAVGLLK